MTKKELIQQQKKIDIVKNIFTPYRINIFCSRWSYNKGVKIVDFYKKFGLITTHQQGKPGLDKYIKSLSLEDIQTPIIIFYTAPTKPDINKDFGNGITSSNFNIFKSADSLDGAYFINKVLFIESDLGGYYRSIKINQIKKRVTVDKNLEREIREVLVDLDIDVRNVDTLVRENYRKLAIKILELKK